jgi:hypothetical protein
MNERSRPDSSLIPKTSRIPEFKSREEEAEFWDTHDFTDFLDESWPVEIRVGDEFRARVEARGGARAPERRTNRRDRADRAALDREARARGIGPSTLVRMWIKDHLRDRPTG